MVMNYIPNHPRPQFTRPSWENLNGIWDFKFDDQNEGIERQWNLDFPLDRQITVPFSYETVKSGIGDETFHPVVWYHRTINPLIDRKTRTLLHFEGSDYQTMLWVNGQYAGCHTGGYTRFQFDITEMLKPENNHITVRVEDSNDIMQPRGKQRWKKENFGCWYVQTTGIWKTVWLEYVPQTYLESVKMTPKLADHSIGLEWKINREPTGAEIKLRVEILFGNKTVNRAEFPVLGRRGRIVLDVGSVEVSEWLVEKWSPDHPNLYDIRFELAENEETTDTVGSYFGMRDIRIDQGNILLNGEPIYQRLVLDQGYWKDSGLTPPDEAAIIEDIDKILALGFNGARKHQKIEDERYAFWCDVKGLLLWCEMPSPYAFGDDMAQNFTSQWIEVVKQHYNHPSIITWTPFNESWGVPQIKTVRQQQHFTEAVYHLTKSLDEMRPVIVNDGWEHTVSDILTLHDYEELGQAFLKRYQDNHEGILKNQVYHSTRKSAFAEGYAYRGQPVIISEYGGAAFAGGEKGSWGYGNTVETVEQYIFRINDMTSAIKKLPWVCGYCYTQITDVQQEINGLLDAERRCKADINDIREINLKKDMTA